MEIIRKMRSPTQKTVFMFVDDEAAAYCELPIHTVKNIISQTSIYLGIWYNKDHQIIGVNTFNNKKWLRHSAQEWNITFLQIHMLTPNEDSFLWTNDTSKQMVEWWNNVR